MLRPISPFVEYVINYDYIAKVLCINKEKVEMDCNGKCYVMKQLKQQQEEDFKALNISIEEYPIGFVELLSIAKTKLIKSNKKEKLFSNKQHYSYLADFSVFHPPKNLISISVS